MNCKELFPKANHHQLNNLLSEKEKWISRPKKGFLRYRTPLQNIAHLRATLCDFGRDTVQIGLREDINNEEHELLVKALQNLIPWRKGPFSVFGVEIDSEWRSDRKWNRIVPHLPDLRDKIVADIGCNNGYYMFRMAHHLPKFVLGFEPYVHHYYTFKTLNTFAQQPNLDVELLGIEHLPLFPDCFDVIFCMGILYHRPSPIAALADLRNALVDGGTAIIESQIIPGDQSHALFPENTYAKVPGTWFVPTAACLANWIARVGFSSSEMFCQHPMSNLEQRKTSWMIFESYEDFIDKNNPTLTIEGYPAPYRVFFKVTR
ncbi:tRNA 5-methoxyuridine(34)/uridine 5-oxyacetic acid(34) synthase CmoB [Desulfogranum japonicum]|uniref:tRNA 5-methoxyuridine(34)/uridine 5-oxyacetic acid(34) synthase CmoB n=1 Tax=Desulfogranum japonicum TaxID=231447 RepID=UPI00048CA163|nr:tRNA 5-methoxyuridine(34)/uridine 5-oxyacetic acid(34) synthase CmoB [Desulfogranum japonicum]